VNERIVIFLSYQPNPTEKLHMKTLSLLILLFFCQFLIAQVPDGMVLIPSGTYIMGKNTPDPTDWQPEYQVAIDAFYLDKCEVTNKEYFEFCQKTKNPLPEFWGSPVFKCSLDYPDHPVTGISYSDAVKYAKWAGKRLPTEAEWEYASRAGLQKGNFPWGDQVDSTFANYGKKYKSTMKVGSFKPNAFGLFDMSGNVWEWTSDNYSHDYYRNSPSQNPKGPDAGRFKVIRGGSWHSGAMCIQTYYRNGLSASWIDFAVGFRCAKDSPGVYSQERNDPKSVLSSFLENSFNGKYLGWTANSADSLRLQASDYIDKIRSFNKPFIIEQGDNCFFVKSYSLDSIRLIRDYAFGYVTLDAVAGGYVLDRLKMLPQKVNKTYLLTCKNSNWYVLAETKFWFTSIKAYTRWAENYLSDITRTEGSEYKNNVRNKLSL
jgi:formylglycine-generating enzyme required for sulfatase activity